MHSHPAYVAHVFNAYTGKALLADGTEISLAREAGDVCITIWPLTKIVNAGKTPIHNLVVELKEVTE